MTPILLAAAILAAPLPAGHGGTHMIPLPVDSDPPGATATVRYRNAKGAEVVESCATPCTLHIARGSPFLYDVERDGRPLAKPAVTWRFEGFSGPNLYPASVRAIAPRP